MNLTYYNHSPFWEDIFSNFSISVPNIPEGYELVEKEEHKKGRLEKCLQEYKEILSYHEGKVQEITKLIQSQESELKSLKSG